MEEVNRDSEVVDVEIPAKRQKNTSRVGYKRARLQGTLWAPVLCIHTDHRDPYKLKEMGVEERGEYHLKLSID